MKHLKTFGVISATAVIIILIAHQTGIFRKNVIKPGSSGYGSARLSRNEKIKVNSVEVPVIYKSPATIRSRDEIELSPRITARVHQITKREGDAVRKGELLVKLDDKDIVATIRKISERLNISRAVLERTEKEYKRQKLLYSKNVIPERDLENSREEYMSAKSAEKAAGHALREIEANLSYTEIRSPMDGIVSERFDDPGDLAHPGSILMKIFDPEKLMIYAPVRESFVKSVAVDDKISFHVGALDKSFTGEIREIVPAVNPGTRTFLVKICILDRNEKLMPGMFATAKFIPGTEKALIIPESALLRTGQLEYVRLVKNNSTLKVPVRTTPYAKGKLRVTTGLDEGDVILK
jgi:RND family efflux transporter MFP subunit